MNITITGRHLNVSEKLRDYAEKKINRLDKFFDQLIDSHVIFYHEKNDQVAEVVINGDGVQFHGREKAADLFSAIDLLFEKMEKQISRYKERHQTHKGPEKVVTAMEITSGRGRDIRLLQVSNKPIDEIEAYLQMKLDNRDFILFKKGSARSEADPYFSNKNYAVMFVAGGSLKMVEAIEDKLHGGEIKSDSFLHYDVNVVNDSPVNPKINFNKENSGSIGLLTIEEAIAGFTNANHGYMPFFNIDSLYMNIIYRSGKNIEILVPAF